MEFIIMLCVVAWGVILTIAYMVNTTFQNQRIKRLEGRINKLATSKCDTYGKREETKKTEGT